MGKVLRLGSRRSRLALAQLAIVSDALKAAGYQPCTFVRDTAGDRDERPLPEIGGKGLFTSELEDDLRAQRIDLAVHSLKDLPVELPQGLEILAVTQRADPSDCLVGRRLQDLPSGARVGTSSLRRSALLRALRPDLVIVPVRGNLDTRLRRLDQREVDALCLATCGVVRLGLEARIAERLDPMEFIPAPGQGIVAAETKAGRDDLSPVQAAIHDPLAGAAGVAERAVLAQLGEGCQLPLGAYARITPDGRLKLRAVVLSQDGRSLLHAGGEDAASHAAALGARVGEDLKQQGAARLLAETSV